MLNFLFAKNKVGFIDGTLMKPEKTATDYMAWMHFDVMVKGWLTTAMKKEIKSSVKYANTASEIWSDLRERFRKESTPHAYELKQTLSNTHQSRISVSAYYTKLRGLWDEIKSVLPASRCTCNKCSCEMGKKTNELRENEKLYQFLMGLDAEFAVIKIQILVMNPIPTLGNTYHLVADEERQRMISGEKKTPPKSAAFKAFKPVRRENNVSQNKNVPKYQKCGDMEEKCTVCGRSGHTRYGCFKIIGYPDWWPGKMKPRVAHVESEVSPVPGLTKEQYYSFLKHFAENDVKDGNVWMANMAVDALDPLNKPICDEIKNHVRPTIDEVQINESTSTEETNKNSVVNKRNEFDGTDDADEHNVNPTLNENEAEYILSETSGPPQDMTEGNEAQPDIP
ncbi:putative RNA-directed DNA polymerase [Tanacetum coccineum]